MVVGPPPLLLASLSIAFTASFHSPPLKRLALFKLLHSSRRPKMSVAAGDGDHHDNVKEEATSTSSSFPSIQGILFDLDGTLLDTESLSDRAMFASLPPIESTTANTGDAKPTQSPPQLLPWPLKRQILGMRSSDWGPIVLNYARDKWKMNADLLPSVEQLGRDWETNLNDYCDQVQACPGALQLVERLAALKLPMAIATSSRQASVDRKRKNHEGMFRHFKDAIVCGDHAAVQRGKPAPDIYLEAARQIGVDPKHCLAFEDALTGVRAAKAAGCIVVAVPDSRFDADEMAVFAQEADLVLADLWHFSGRPFGLNVEMKKADDRSNDRGV